MALNTEHRPRLYGREAECETLAELVSDVRHGRGAVLAVRGEPGAGKTALLDYAAGLAGDLRVAQAAGAESEAGLAYAGVHQLCGSMTSLAQPAVGPAAGRA